MAIAKAIKYHFLEVLLSYNLIEFIKLFLGDTNLTSVEHQTKIKKAFLFPKARKIIAMLAVLIILGSGTISVAEEDDKDKEKSSSSTYEKLKAFSEILSLVESNYVEEVESDVLIEGAIRGMVKSLDPHSSYLPPKSYKDMLVDTSGKFGGLGIEISIRKP